MLLWNHLPVRILKILPVTIFRKLVPDGSFSRDPGLGKQRYLWTGMGPVRPSLLARAVAGARLEAADSVTSSLLCPRLSSRESGGRRRLCRPARSRSKSSYSGTSWTWSTVRSNSNHIYEFSNVVLRIRIFSIPDPGSKFFSIPEPGSASKNLSILTKKLFFKLFISCKPLTKKAGSGSTIQCTDPKNGSVSKCHGSGTLGSAIASHDKKYFVEDLST